MRVGVPLTGRTAARYRSLPAGSDVLEYKLCDVREWHGWPARARVNHMTITCLSCTAGGDVIKLHSWPDVAEVTTVTGRRRATKQKVNR